MKLSTFLSIFGVVTIASSLPSGNLDAGFILIDSTSWRPEQEQLPLQVGGCRAVPYQSWQYTVYPSHLCTIFHEVDCYGGYIQVKTAADRSITKYDVKVKSYHCF